MSTAESSGGATESRRGTDGSPSLRDSEIRAPEIQVEVELNKNRTAASVRDAVLDNPVFGEAFTDHMVTMSYENGRWGTLRLRPFGDLSLSPAALALHYGQSIFEALKAYRVDDGSVALFRPSVNAERMNTSAQRIAMPTLPTGVFELSCALLAEADRDWVPTADGAALYLRPFMFASEPHLSVRPATEYLFAVIASPVASYFGQHLRAITVAVESDDVRATPGGTGSVKFAGNYAAGFAAHLRAGDSGHDQVLWLDAGEHRFVEELNAMNVMFLWRRRDRVVLTTPPLGGTILEGVTRSSLLDLASKDDSTLGIDTVSEEPTSIDQLRSGVDDGSLLEMFACGTAAVIAPIGQLTHKGHAMVIGDGSPGVTTMALRRALLDVQYGLGPDPDGWLSDPAETLRRYGIEIDGTTAT